MTDLTLADRLRTFYASLAEFKAEAHPSAEMGPIYNALLTEAMAAVPDNATVKAMEMTDRFNMQSTMDAGTMRASIAQILAAMGEPTEASTTPRSGGETLTGDLATKEW